MFELFTSLSFKFTDGSFLKLIALANTPFCNLFFVQQRTSLFPILIDRLILQSLIKGDPGLHFQYKTI